MKTIQGDTWDVLSIRAYGNAGYMDELIMANPSQRMVTIFPAGVDIVIPDIDTTQTAQNLPPWKRRASHG